MLPTDKAGSAGEQNKMNEIPKGHEQCESCGKVDVLANMHLTHNDTILCDGCNDALTARAEAVEELEVETDY